MTLSPLNCSSKNIWQYAQNKPSLICADLERLWDVPRWLTAKVLMARGVYKWLSVRRRLIRLKNVWKSEIRRLNEAIGSRQIRRGTPEYFEARGRLWALVECRKSVRDLCHSERWADVDHDKQDSIFTKRRTVRHEASVHFDGYGIASFGSTEASGCAEANRFV